MYTTQELLVPPCKLTLPSGVRVSIERPSEETVDGALDVVRSAAVTGDGISSDEVPTRDALLTPSPRMATCVIINMDDASIIAVCIRIHSPLCRSSSPVYCAGPFVTSAQYRGRGLGFEVMQTLGRVHMTQTLYRGFLARATLTAPTRLQYKHQQGYNVGLIPGCTYLSGKGIIDDVVACNEIYTDELKRSWTKESQPALPALIRRTPLPHLLRSQSLPVTKLHCPKVPFKSGLLQSKLADEEELWQVEDLIRDCAEQGDGFAIDEFTAEGYFNRVLLRDSHVVVCVTPEGAIAAAVIFGFSALCRSREANQVGGYLLVSKGYRGQGLGRSLVQLCIMKARELGYVAILTDVFVDNDKATRMLREEGFLITATLPNVAILKDTGYSDSYLVWRPVDDIKMSQVLKSKV